MHLELKYNLSMKETISREELNKMDKEVLVTLLMGMQEQLERSNETIDALRATVEKLNEQIRIMNTRMFGKSSEKSLAPSDQLSIYDFGFNEAEETVQGRIIEEPEMEEVVIHRRKRKGKREEDLSGFEAVPVEHGLTEEELSELFGAMMTVDHISLMRSDRGKHGMIYTEL